jgi:hypothetical protein
VSRQDSTSGFICETFVLEPTFTVLHVDRAVVRA